MRHESQTRRTFLTNAGLIALVSGAGANVVRPSAAWAAAKVGEAAPPFTATTSTGPSVSLGDYRGKIVILEWTNHDCPYVKKHYETDQHAGPPEGGDRTGCDLADRDLIGARHAGIRESIGGQ